MKKFKKITNSTLLVLSFILAFGCAKKNNYACMCTNVWYGGQETTESMVHSDYDITKEEAVKNCNTFDYKSEGMPGVSEGYYVTSDCSAELIK